MTKLRGDLVFLMMGRPNEAYGKHVLQTVSDLGLENRAFLWERPSDETWKKALQGADIGHLVQGPFPAGPTSRLHELNSSLSNYRVFSYMAAGLPIISYADSRMESLHRRVPCFRTVRLANFVDDLTLVLSDLARDPVERRRLGEAGRRAHEMEYNWENQFGPILNALASTNRSVGLEGFRA
jgi:hypothetical protein